MGTWKTFDVRGARAQEHARVVVTAGLDAGVNFFDSSPMYGEAERVLGAALQHTRARALIATKIWASSAREGRQQALAALQFFGGRIDLYQIHNLANWREQLTLLEELHAQGLVRAIGATHYQASAFAELEHVMKTGRITSIQVPYNPRERAAERTMLPLAQDLGIGVVVMRPFGEGVLLHQVPTAAELQPLAAFVRYHLAAGSAEMGAERQPPSRRDPCDLQRGPHPPQRTGRQSAVVRSRGTRPRRAACDAIGGARLDGSAAHEPLTCRADATATGTALARATLCQSSQFTVVDEGRKEGDTCRQTASAEWTWVTSGW
jgi:diketogulonate reductase-like aldo/keto reductase